MIKVTLGNLGLFRSKLKHALETIDNRAPLLRLCGEMISGEIQRNMTRGLDLERGKMTPTQPWTRAASAATGRKQRLTNIKPLLQTGQLRASIGPQAVTNDYCIVGPNGKQREKLQRMAEGKRGLMLVSERPVKGLYSGIIHGKNGDYCKIYINGRWIKKRVKSGYIEIKPRKRNPMVVGPRANKLAFAIAKKYLREALK